MVLAPRPAPRASRDLRDTLIVMFSSAVFLGLVVLSPARRSAPQPEGWHGGIRGVEPPWKKVRGATEPGKNLFSGALRLDGIPLPVDVGAGAGQWLRCGCRLPA
jgi:hypothetical protein